MSAMIVGMALGGEIDCKPLIKSAFDNTGCSSKCVMIAGSGLTSGATHISFKGNMMNNNGVLVQNGKVAFLSSDSYACDAKNRYQPFLVSGSTSFDTFNLYSNGSIRAGDNMYNMRCFEEFGNLISFNHNDIHLSFILKISDQCDQLHFGESCSTPSTTGSATTGSATTGSATTGSATTGSSTTGSPATFTFDFTLINTWVIGDDEFSQYNVDIKNNGATDIKTLVFSHENFEPTDKWNVESLPNGDLTLPSWAGIGAGQKYTFGFITKLATKPVFTVKSSSS
ncbi:hypothetical protein PPL_11515 [Heterostelium album PN500]|uniref:Carbohydrate binding domain-containing protein n=1 Tax=Heterostelium pallidum (strain ATCC 26659 / Pp 5 / PN500) TaxID=670386 RepID=D3BTL8_HETP5|nr:hypothetical protein PPL_11515 [Heterostelium album PN500]EFA75435.1 hypothetical protein PPL_11515 [Heterostelium album PN500]|eukprot:XP_020427569.1 hypothetical protein PPL_11515 [Heterostelium album PN500]